MRYVVVLSLSTWPDKFFSNDEDRIVTLAQAVAWAERNIGPDTICAIIYELQGYTIVNAWVLDKDTWRKP